MRFVTLPNGATVLLTVFLAACGSGAAVGAYGPSRAAAVAPATPSSAPGMPTAVVPPGPSPTAVPTAAPTVVPAPPPLAHATSVAHVTSQAFPLVAVGDAGARGSITVTTELERSVISVVVGGLPPGSVHSVHLHLGNCPGAGSHILVLGTLRADAAGSGAVTSTVDAVFTGPGHFVIVYVGPAAGPLGACANLG